MNSLCRAGFLCAAAIAASGCAHRPPDDPADPLEPMNRVIFKVNDKADQYVFHPVAKGYVYVTPTLVQQGISNFFNNLGEPKTIVNDVLQAKFRKSAAALWRFAINTTAGVGGFIDVATMAGVERQPADLGLTLGYWGVPEGWYLVLPFFGPSDARDTVGRAGDTFIGYGYYLPGRYDVESFSATGVDAINTRANLLSADGLLNSQFDKYLFLRTAFLQRRQALIYDGNPPPEMDLPMEDAPDDSSAKKGKSGR